MTPLTGYTGRLLDIAWTHSKVHGRAATARVSSVGHRLLLTGTEDGTAHMHCVGRSEPVLVFRGTKRNDPGGGIKGRRASAGGKTPSSGASKSSARARSGSASRSGSGSSSSVGAAANPRYSAAVNNVSFFYLDQLVLLTSGSTLYAYRFMLDALEVRACETWEQCVAVMLTARAWFALCVCAWCRTPRMT